VYDCKGKIIFILGYSGHAYVVMDAIYSMNGSVAGYFEVSKAKENPYDIPYLGYEQNMDISKIVGDQYLFPAVGANEKRKEMIKMIENRGIKKVCVIHDSATISPKAKIGL
jgi:hypothetical protein